MGGEVKKNWNYGHPERDVKTATKILLLMSRAGISQVGLAAELGVSDKAINNVIWGTLMSKRIRLFIAEKLGFESWDELKNYRMVI